MRRQRNLMFLCFSISALSILGCSGGFGTDNIHTSQVEGYVFDSLESIPVDSGAINNLLDSVLFAKTTVTFFSRSHSGEFVDFFFNGSYEGRLTYEYVAGNPTCGDEIGNKTIVLELGPGVYEWQAQVISGTYLWYQISRSFSVDKTGGCSLIQIK